MRNCNRTFVREDLLARHKERHSNSDKEYQWQLEHGRKEHHRTAGDTPFSTDRTATSLNAASPGGPALEYPVDNTRSYDAGHLLPPITDRQVQDTQYGRNRRLLETTPAPRTLSAPLDPNAGLATDHIIESAHPGVNEDVISSDIYGPPRTWQDELTLFSDMPDFGSKNYNRSPFAMPDEFINFLFDGNIQAGANPISTPTLQTSEFDAYVTNIVIAIVTRIIDRPNLLQGPTGYQLSI